MQVQGLMEYVPLQSMHLYDARHQESQFDRVLESGWQPIAPVKAVVGVARLSTCCDNMDRHSMIGAKCICWSRSNLAKRSIPSASHLVLSLNLLFHRCGDISRLRQ
jgi:hypothetical protein